MQHDRALKTLPSAPGMSSKKHFASWLSLAPGTKVSGGKKLSGRTKFSASRAAAALRLAARSL
jgi:transposase